MLRLMWLTRTHYLMTVSSTISKGRRESIYSLPVNDDLEQWLRDARWCHIR